MPKSKKRKINHQRHTGQNGDLSHEEIWDDSALIRSWNEAVEEYEYYHSIHAKGEDVDEVLRQAEAAEKLSELLGPSEVNPNASPNDVEVEMEDGELEDHEITTHNNIAPKASAISDQRSISDPVLNHHAEPALDRSKAGGLHKAITLTGVDAVDQLSTNPHTLASVTSQVEPQLPSADDKGAVPNGSATQSTDQTLENIKMAYYWAGYYSGLYDGQRQQQQEQASSTQLAQVQK